VAILKQPRREGTSTPPTDAVAAEADVETPSALVPSLSMSFLHSKSKMERIVIHIPEDISSSSSASINFVRFVTNPSHAATAHSSSDDEPP
jgi:hypothetical protein